MKALALITLLLSASSGCSGTDTDTDTDGAPTDDDDTEAETDTDTDTDGAPTDDDDTEAETDTGPDTDADTNTGADADTDSPEELPPNCYHKPTGVLACECSASMPCICAHNEDACMFYLMEKDAEIQCDAPCLLFCGFPGVVCEIDSCSGEIVVCSDAVRVCDGPCPNTK